MRMKEYVGECPTYARKNHEGGMEADASIFPHCNTPAGRLRVDLRKFNMMLGLIDRYPGYRVETDMKKLEIAREKRLGIVRELNRRVRNNVDLT